MDRETKKILEYEFGLAFLESLGDYDLENIKHDDNPDFIVKTEKHIGIELTQIYNTIQSKYPRIYLEGSWDSLMDASKRIWENNNLPNAHVSINFNQYSPIRKSKIEEKAMELVDLVKNHIPPIGESWSSNNNPNLVLINGISGFNIERICDYNHSIWTYYDHIWSPTLKSSIVQKTINKKEFHRKSYLNSCDLIWLVMIIHGGRASGNFIVPKDTIECEYNFKFDRVFLFNTLPRTIHELNGKARQK
ncbi:hypothetical protein [Ekhidna sp.]|uniref:hypothetical protein n=1 Tax=Ekhidna sp. TaxID=2608089 RepID=UPI003517DBBA